MNHFFGEVVNGAMSYSLIGNKARECWEKIPSHFPAVELDVYVVMPNHVHGIIIIHENPDSHVPENAGAHVPKNPGRDVACNVLYRA